ncbi:MAG: peptidylprolyl isomerase [Thermoleophilia bacterium]|nr:peptidylprolyl isomerase [Thermoleophilia bacterium]
MTIDPAQRYTATLATDQGAIGVELLAKQAPHTVNNFKFLADQGFYTNTSIHRVVRDFMFQSGDPTGTGTGGPGYSFADELPPAGTVYAKGTVAMANAGPNTNGSQFFIMTADAALPPAYSIFGKVTSGMDVVERLNGTPVGPSPSGEVSSPLAPITFRDITVEEHGA